MLLLSIANFIAMSFEPASLSLRSRKGIEGIESIEGIEGIESLKSIESIEGYRKWASLSLRRLRAKGKGQKV